MSERETGTEHAIEDSGFWLYRYSFSITLVLLWLLPFLRPHAAFGVGRLAVEFWLYFLLAV